MNRPTRPERLVDFTIDWGPLIGLILIYLSIFAQLWARYYYGGLAEHQVYPAIPKLLTAMVFVWLSWAGSTRFGFSVYFGQLLLLPCLIIIWIVGQIILRSLTYWPTS